MNSLIPTLIFLNFFTAEVIPLTTVHSPDGQNYNNDKGKGEEEEHLYEGDIVLSTHEILQVHGEDDALEVQTMDGLEDDTKVKRMAGEDVGESGARPLDSDATQGLRSSNFSYHIWSTTIPYKFDQFLDHDQRLIIAGAMELWMNGTCIRFVVATRADQDYLLFREGQVCGSRIGRVGGEQVISIADDCLSVGKVAHLIGHSLGLWHETSRPDRDDYIEILEENIADPANVAAFSKISKKLFELMPDVGYDVQSIMHLSEYAYGKPGKKTIRIKDNADLDEESHCPNRLPIGQRMKLSSKDRKRINLLYGCNASLAEDFCPTPPPTVSSEAPPTTTAAITPPRLKKRLRTRNVIALTFHGGRYGIECKFPYGCTPRQCFTHHLSGYNTCEEEYHQFQIINHKNITKKGIRSGNTVLLRSMASPGKWLDCSSRRCRVSQCYEDGIQDPYNSTCSQHHFEVWGMNRRHGKILSSHHKLQFKGRSGDFMNCNGRFCTLLEEGECQRAKYQTIRRDEPCPIQGFSVIKLSEI